MVAALFYQALHLAFDIFHASLLGKRQTDKGHFGPYQNTGAVTQRVKIIVVLVVGQTHRVGAQLLDQGQVRVHLCRGHSVAYAAKILVACNAPQLQVLPVEEKTLVRCNADLAESGLHTAGVQQSLVCPGLHFCGIQMGVSGALPQVRGGHIQMYGKGGLRSQLQLALGGKIGVSIGQPHSHPAGAVRAVVHQGTGDLQLPAAVRLFAGAHLHTIPAAVRLSKVNGAVCDQTDIPVYPAVKREIGHTGIHIVALGIVGLQQQGVFSRLQPVIQGQTVQREGEPVLRCQLAVDIYPVYQRGCTDLQVQKGLQITPG